MREPKQYTDQCLKDTKWILDKILKEHVEQIIKWGVQTHSAFEWLTYTAEELGSLAKAISAHEYRGGSRKKVVSEAIQVATLALKIAEMFDKAIQAKEESHLEEQQKKEDEFSQKR